MNELLFNCSCQTGLPGGDAAEDGVEVVAAQREEDS